MIIARHLRQLRAGGREYGAGPWSVPFLLAHDRVETASMGRGALRYRTVVL
jgi:hypothetical protein